ncbi:carboxylesterase family protein [Saccharothrix deserti]|uniref:carboxylesterase family protein n=1 Tax=Saccharothrix deserti TaxID=2593674 RepID=UPI00192E3464|nr:carboxylesterase family protein [Saccharothrix deserti]
MIGDARSPQVGDPLQSSGTPHTGTAIATDLLAALGLDKVEDLLHVPVEEILEVQNRVVDADLGRRSLPGGRGWGVVVDGSVLPRHPQQAVADGAAAGIGLLVGADRDEMRLFQALQGPSCASADEQALLTEMQHAGVASPERLLAAYRHRSPDADPTALRTLFLTDAVYRRPADRLAAAQVTAGGRAHTYLFSAEPLGPTLGARHGAELTMLFDRVDPAAPDLVAVRDDLTAAWARFAATGDPGWPLYDPHAGANSRQFGGSTDMVTEPPADDATATWTERP